VAASARRVLPSTNAWLRASECSSAAALPWIVEKKGTLDNHRVTLNAWSTT
jgi:hypothetical protein